MRHTVGSRAIRLTSKSKRKGKTMNQMSPTISHSTISASSASFDPLVQKVAQLIAAEKALNEPADFENPDPDARYALENNWEAAREGAIGQTPGSIEGLIALSLYWAEVSKSEPRGATLHTELDQFIRSLPTALGLLAPQDAHAAPKSN